MARSASASSQDQQSLAFKHVGKKQYGYDPKQVENFVRKARTAYESETNRSMRADDVAAQSFDGVREGYNPYQVDQMLDRLEDAFRRIERDEFINANGIDAWNAEIDDNIRAIMGRLNRPDGDRFRRPEHKKTQGYKTADVDLFCRRLHMHLTDETSLEIAEMRGGTFRAATGEDAYDEAQVDYFIRDAIAILVVLE